MGTFEKKWTLNFTQCYPKGDIKFSELSNILQITASEHAEKIGFGYLDMMASSQSWVLSRMLIEIEKLPRYTQSFTVRTWIENFTGIKSIRNFEIILNDQIIITSTSLWVVFNIEKRKAETLNLNTEHIKLMRNKSTTKNDLKKISLHTNQPVIGKHQVKLSDLDIANHANNVKYMEWCFDTLDPQSITNGSIRALEMNFLRELKLDDQVQITQGGTKEIENIYQIEKDNQIHFVMKLSLDFDS